MNIEIFGRGETVKCDVGMELRCILRRVNLPTVHIVLDNHVKEQCVDKMFLFLVKNITFSVFIFECYRY